MNKIPLLEKFAAQSLVYVDTGLSDGKELIFSKEKFAELIVKECADLFEVEYGKYAVSGNTVAEVLKRHFGVEE